MIWTEGYYRDRPGGDLTIATLDRVIEATVVVNAPDLGCDVVQPCNRVLAV